MDHNGFKFQDSRLEFVGDKVGELTINSQCVPDLLLLCQQKQGIYKQPPNK